MQSVLKNNIAELQSLLEEAETLESGVTAAANILAAALRRGDKLLACGNGGSAADASHLTTEFVCRYNRDRRPYPAISLATHGGDLTAIGNDYSFDDLFARQVEAFGKPGDVLVAFTTSGNSENVRRALLMSKTMQMSSIVFLGKDGGVCKGLADVELHIDSQTTARVQEVHGLLFHSMCELVEAHL